MKDGEPRGAEMGMTGDTTKTGMISVICPSCGEEYDTPERVTEILRNSGFCVNLTCLQDLSREPLEAVLGRKTDTRRSTDRRAI
jgi:hypothetical protein